MNPPSNPLGRSLTGSRAAAARLIAAGAVPADLGLVAWNRYPESVDGRWLLAVIVLVGYAHLARGDLPSLGLAAPVQGWRSLARLTAWVAMITAVVVGLAAGAWVAAGLRLPVHVVAPAEIGPAVVRMCLVAPVLEETLYRLAVCAPLAGRGRPVMAVVASGLLFGLLHVAYGNPSPENLLGGFVLAWAFVHTGSIYVPALLHGLGNLCVLLGQVAAWYWLARST